jgi:hypothetical protein
MPARTMFLAEKANSSIKIFIRTVQKLTDLNTNASHSIEQNRRLGHSLHRAITKDISLTAKK